MLEGDVITNVGEIVDKYSNIDTVIPKGSLFYKDTVVSKSDLPDSIIYEYKDGYVLVNMAVTTATTYGNKVFPGNYIDIYLKAVNKIEEGSGYGSEADRVMLLFFLFSGLLCD